MKPKAKRKPESRENQIKRALMLLTLVIWTLVLIRFFVMDPWNHGALIGAGTVVLAMLIGIRELVRWAWHWIKTGEKLWDEVA